jgi:hypothetical protein
MALERQDKDGGDVGEIHGMNTTERGGLTCVEVTRVMTDPSIG